MVDCVEEGLALVLCDVAVGVDDAGGLLADEVLQDALGVAVKDGLVGVQQVPGDCLGAPLGPDVPVLILAVRAAHVVVQLLHRQDHRLQLLLLGNERFDVIAHGHLA